ncbi:hypothetical protein HG536_0G01530 [Torulaspora globosa]|uniref:Telomere length regulation protein conserved domain-containing protein n=1 Tax=Torulaspora globosa TaxID=48254 RepID=A0A7G3ZLA8_9SACH|nr:uncharacterized protein HG536_0G01530 [Torulaspora globosa]QLL34294.1 hypothetical protein HG536_0G01530 [Torulaspora globosa]
MGNSDIALLENSPNASVFHTVLKSLNERDELLSLVEILPIIKKVVPIYPSLRQESRKILLNLLSRNFNFIAQLVSFTSSLPEKQAEKRIYKSLIVKLIVENNQCLLNYLKQCATNKILYNDMKALLFGSKLFNCISTEMDITDYLRLLREHWRYALTSTSQQELMQRGNQLGELLITMLTLHPVLTRVIMAEEFLLTTTEFFKSLKIIVHNSTPLNRQKLLKNLIYPYLDVHATRHNCQSVYSILRELAIGDSVDGYYILRLNSPVLQECTVRLLSSNSSARLLRLLLQMFAKIDIASDEKVCEILVMVLKYSCNSDLKSRIGTDTKFLDGVTARLMHKDHVVRERTMFVAKVVSNGDVKYDSDFVIDIPDLKLSDDNLTIDFSSLSTSATDPPNMSRPSTQPPVDNSFSVDSDDDDSDYDEKGREIVFLKDLVMEFARLENKRGISPLSLLKLTVKLVRQKKDFPSEVSYYSTGLLSSIACLNNNLDEPHFEQGRINALVSMLVVTPDKATELMRIFFTSELSLQQKISILSSFGLSARELRGFDDESIAKPQYDFPTSRLPWDKPENASIDDHQLAYGQDLSMQKVVWKSKKLTTSYKKEPMKNRFRRYAGLFFYPLAQAWLDGINLGTFDELFKSHYLMTLHIIYRCADPVHDYDRITELMKEVLADASQQGIKI